MYSVNLTSVLNIKTIFLNYNELTTIMKKIFLILLVFLILLFITLFIAPFIYKAVFEESFMEFPLNKNEIEESTDSMVTNENIESDIKYDVTGTEPEEILDLPEHCIDRIYNEGEEGLDCGWTCPNKCKFIEKCGELKKDETWSGNIHLKCSVRVLEGTTLIIEPGTIVKVKHNRDYKILGRNGISVNGGTIKAKGTKEKRIWFTSAADEPINGDWSGISVESSQDSEFDYIIVEFGEMGVEQLDSSVPITNSIIRWINAEGFYAERSKPVFINNLLYSNGYHEIALEQFNENVQIKNNIFRDGHYAIHHEKTSSVIEGNYFEHYQREVISAGMESDLIVKNNKFENVGESVFHIYDGSTIEKSGNDLGEGSLEVLQLGFEDIKNFELNYIPGEEGDKFPYVYADEDETRKVIKKIGKDLYFGWALVYANNYLWRFSLGDGEIGSSLDFIRVNPVTGEYQKFGNDEIMNPRGLTWDGEYFWVNDFSLLKIFKFQLKNNFVEIIDSFDIPEKEIGGTMGLTTDNEFLYLRSRDGEKIYKLDKTGQLIDKIYFQYGIGQDLVWTGEFFWTTGGCEKGICKWTKNGKIVGEIYLPAKDPWAIAWDGKYLWTIQRTSEMWNDPKIYQIEVLDDSLDHGWLR